jgi:hypothetical protein
MISLRTFPTSYKLARRINPTYKTHDIAGVVAAMTESEPGAQSEIPSQSTPG